MKPRIALYVGGMGHRDKNFHKEMMSAAASATPPSGSRSCTSPSARTRRSPRCPTSSATRWRWSARSTRIRERYRAWADSGITGLTVVTEQPEAMELMASLR